MKEFLYIKWWLLGIYIAIGISFGIVAGMILKPHANFEAGYTYAYREMNCLLKEGMEDEGDFFIPGLNYKFSPRTGKKPIINYSIAGMGDEGLRKVWTPNQKN